MTQTGQREAIVPIAIGGMFSAGDPSSIPLDKVLDLRNYAIRANRFEGRGAFIYDGLMQVLSFLRWEDLASDLTKLLAINFYAGLANLSVRNTSATGSASGYGSPLVSGNATAWRLTDFTNYKGKLYAVLEDPVTGLPIQAFVYDGTNLSASPFNTPIVGRTITTYKERVYVTYPRVTVTNMIAATVSGPYSWSAAEFPLVGWGTLTSCVAVTFVTGSSPVKKIGRVTPTATTGANASWGPNSYTNFFDSSAGSVPFVLRMDLRSTSPSYSMPFTMEIFIATNWIANHVYAKGDLISDNGSPAHMQRVTTAGTSGGAPPVWNATTAGTTADNTVTWTNEGSDAFASTEAYLPPLDSSGEWYTFWATGAVPIATNSQFVLWRFKFGNTSTGTIALVPIEVGFRDGYANGDPRKQNYGAQLTKGDFYFPFYNLEGATSTATLNIEAVIFSEIGQPARILAKNTVTLPEIAGHPTAAAVVAGRYLVFKRRGFWVFKVTSDKNVPILPEQDANVEVGCVGPRAWDIFNNTIFFIGENGIYRMGSDWNPQEIGGPGMREEIIAKTSNYVEYQTGYTALSFRPATTDVVTCGTDASLRATGDQSIGGWVYPLSDGTLADTICGNQTLGASGVHLYVDTATGKLRFLTNQDGVFVISTSDGTVPLSGAWSHVFVVRSGTTATFYINGVPAGTASGVTAPIVATAAFQLGTSDNGGSGASYLSGMLREIRYYNAAISASEVLNIYNGTPSALSSLKGLWLLGEGSGTTAADTSGTGNTGTLAGSPTWFRTAMNQPLVAIEHENQEVWVYTQKGKIYVYHIPTESWSRIDVSGFHRVRAMLYDQVNQRMLVSFGNFGTTYLDKLSANTGDTIDSTNTPLTITNDVIPKPLELFGPRYEAYVEEMGLFHLATASQSGQTLTLSYSLDRGKTWTVPAGYPAQIDPTHERIPLPVGTLGPSVMIKISRSGLGGAANWSISKADGKLRVLRGELPWANAVSV